MVHLWSPLKGFRFMNIVLLTSIFPPEPIVGAQTAFSLARELSKRGHHVTVITSFPSRPAGKLYPGYRRQLYKKDISPEGFEIVRCFSVPSSKSTLSSRTLENVTFGATAALYLLFLPRVEVVYSNTWLIFATGLMSIVSKIRGIPYLTRVVDLYPESLVSQNRTEPGSLMFRLIRGIDVRISKGASRVIVLTKYFEKTYIEDRGISPDKVRVIPDWVEGDLDLVDTQKSFSVREKFGIQSDAFLAVYGGNIGVAAGVDTLISASTLTPDVSLLIAGDGSERSACQELAKRIAPEKVFFYSPWPKEETMAVYQSADVLVLPTYGAQSIASIPSKLIRYMLSGRPVIAASLPGTELANIISQSHCGWIIPPDDPQALAQALNDAKRLGVEERARLGMLGREYALKTFAATINLPTLVAALELTSTMQKGQSNENG
jgi:colanic acid biosynthesis glycosyl transferase WcaI